MTLTHDEFNDEVDSFVDDVTNAANCLDTEWSADVTMASAGRLRSVVDATLPLRGPGDSSAGELAELKANYKLCVDSYGTHIAVDHSSFQLKAKIERTPIIRWDYDRSPNNKPRSHIQITAHRGALSHMLSRLDHETPHSIESLHIPMGGERFRPCLEDVMNSSSAIVGFKVAKGGGRRYVKVARGGAYTDACCRSRFS